MAKRKISLGWLAEQMNITLSNLSILKTGKAKAIRFSTLANICRILDCQPADILEYVPDDDEAESGADVGKHKHNHSIPEKQQSTIS